ncbi:MAG: S-layer homology domain-containing protein [Candidatus Sericytochromatia bacterium]|nr:S-layer homology domain-containing protein [Candidatus Tanganyikabacteria bacterium]
MALGLALWGVAGLPARAHVVEHAFKDVPQTHWAADAVADMAIKRSLMASYADDTFRGEQPFSRAQFARSLMILVDELEEISKTSWRPAQPAKYDLADVVADLPERRQILTLVNDYRLWETIPTVSSTRFNPDQTVTRSEVATVVRNLLALGEAKNVVFARDPRKTDELQNRFKDIAPSEWAYHAILGVDQRYRVMIGFPDVSFRPTDEVSRYQYAAVGSATFKVIRDLVRKTMEEKELIAEKLRRDRFQEQRPLSLSAFPGYTVGGAAQGVNLSLGARYVAYPDDVLGLGAWFFLADARAAIGPAFGGSLTLGGLPQLPSVKVPGLGDLQLQPYVGLRGFYDGVNATSPVGVAPLVLGGVAHFRSGPWGYHLLADASPFALPLVANPLSANVSVGGDYLVSPKLAVGGGLGLSWLPSQTLPAPTLGINLGF